MSVTEDVLASAAESSTLSYSAHPVSRGQRWWASRAGKKLAFEVLIVVSVYQVYTWARLLTRDEYATAVANTRRVVGWQGELGLLIEDNLQRVALSIPGLIWLLNRYYVYVHFSVSVTFLIWLYVRRGHLYARVRRVLLGTTLVGLVLHVSFPLAPPRMFPSMGFVDTITQFGPRIYDDERVTAAVNQIAAMPSLHFGWAVIVAWGVVRSLSHRMRWLVVLHPLATLAAIVLTANHWWLDAAVAGVIVGGLVWIDNLLFYERAGATLSTSE